MILKALALSTGLAVAAASSGSAATIGQPLFIAEAGASGFVLDFFQGGFPSGLKEVNATATITQQFGAVGFIGGAIRYSMDLGGNGTLSVGALDLDIITFTAGFAGAFGDDFADTGLITTTFLVEFPVISTSSEPGSGRDIFLLNLDPFGTGLEIERFDEPYVEIGVNIFYDGPLPVKLFNDGAGTLANYIEGSFTPTRIEVGLVGGPPVATVPLPAGGLLLLTGLLGFAGLRRQRNLPPTH